MSMRSQQCTESVPQTLTWLKAQESSNAGVCGPQALWVRSGCAGSGLEELLDGGGIPSTANLMQYLGAIEQRTNHLLHVRHKPPLALQ